ncbi:hypothetical protein CCHR01_02684 [Colletotrichum chrysophilum]|uniref:Uncharacterized protein n=1 Tax=Colletotrichum chrysophilum TaxID=1836956 RepID=A0AAD9ENC4_9PEZI|nr:hypothetical protein CCHR01_02684 [Colletotrichum chrysophilum]
MGSHRVLAAICAAVALVDAQSIPNDLQFEFVLALVTPTTSSSSNTILAPSNIVSTPSAVVSSDASTTPRISVNPGSTTASVAIPTRISGSVTLDTPGSSVLSTSSRLSIPISVPTPHLAHTAERNIHIVRRPLFEHRLIQHVDEHHTVEHHISKHIFFKHVIIGFIIVELLIFKHIIIKHAISKHFVVEHLVIRNLISEHLIFKQLIVKPLVVYIHVRKFYKCYSFKHLIIGFIVIAHFIVKQHITKLHNVYGYVHKFYENYIVKHIEQFVLRATYGNCQLRLQMSGTYSVGNTITVGNTPAGEYQLSDQIYTPDPGYNANPIFQVAISCADTANPAVADFLLDNFSLTDSTQCP